MTHNTTYYEMPQEMYPVHLFHPEFETLGLWFPALDAWVLEMLLSRFEGFRSVMEIGTFVGGSASVLSRHANILLCVDTWAGSGVDGDEMAPLYDGRNVFEVFQKNSLGFRGIVKHHKRTLDPDSLPRYLHNHWSKFDLIFIDGGHDYESVRRDIAIAKEFVAPGGIICGHDFTMFDGVTKAVLDFGDEVGKVNACGTVWWKEM